jgi:nucleotide-binding universal stress UspA family protein
MSVLETQGLTRRLGDLGQRSILASPVSGASRRTIVSRIRRIVYASDFSKASGPAFTKAIDLAKAYRAELLVLHVLSIVPPFVGEGYVAPRIWEEIEAGARAAAQTQLDGLVAKARKAGLRAKGLVVLGSPYEDIVRAARRQRADLLVIGTHGRTGLTKVLLGSVAERVVRMSTCPVMTVRGA